jgi:hypothetical protein
MARHKGGVRRGDVFVPAEYDGMPDAPRLWVWSEAKGGVRLRQDYDRRAPIYLTVDETTLRVDYVLAADNPCGTPVLPPLLSEGSRC